ncbi:MAG: molybdopterin dinucleotide binding domain-containing protein, partial [Promethearchaeota archaeon]
NPQDAIRLSLNEDEMVRLENNLGSMIVPIEITTDVMPGVVCYPHGWGHKNPHLSFANQHPGENINVLTNSNKLDSLCGMPQFNGYKVKLKRK